MECNTDFPGKDAAALGRAVQGSEFSVRFEIGVDRSRMTREKSARLLCKTANFGGGWGGYLIPQDATKANSLSARTLPVLPAQLQLLFWLHFYCALEAGNCLQIKF
jgi:hypothetical protein